MISSLTLEVGILAHKRDDIVVWLPAVETEIKRLWTGPIVAVSVVIAVTIAVAIAIVVLAKRRAPKG